MHLFNCKLCLFRDKLSQKAQLLLPDSFRSSGNASHLPSLLLSLSVPSGPPQNLRMSSRNTTSITLTWSDPTLDRINDRDGVTGFVVKKDGVEVVTIERREQNITVRTYTFTGLSVATSYSFEVLAINDQGTAAPNHAARLTVTTASGGMHNSQLNTLLPHCLTASSLPSLPLPLPSLAVPSSPTLHVVLPRFSNTFLVWSDPEPFVGDITGFQIRYLIDGVPLTIPELGGGVQQYSVSGIKGSEGKTHSVSLRAKTAAGYGHYSDPVVFTFKPIGEMHGSIHTMLHDCFHPKLPAALCGCSNSGHCKSIFNKVAGVVGLWNLKLLRPANRVWAWGSS